MSTAPARLRNAFLELLDEDAHDPGACELILQMLECTDTLPREYCEMVEVAEGTSFGEVARALSGRLGCAEA